MEKGLVPTTHTKYESKRPERVFNQSWKEGRDLLIFYTLKKAMHCSICKTFYAGKATW